MKDTIILTIRTNIRYEDDRILKIAEVIRSMIVESDQEADHSYIKSIEVETK